MMPRFISLEGSEGAGKSSAIETIQSVLNSWKVPYVITREPGGEPQAEKIRDILLHSDHLDAKTELLLMFAARNEHVVKVIRPALASGKWVVSDRFVDASFAYQGGGRQIDLTILQFLERLTVGQTMPDLTLYLDVKPEVGLARAAARSDKDRIEKEQLDFFYAIRNAYLERANQNPHRIKKINANCALSEVNESIRQTMVRFQESMNG